jgi:elongator complex protein 6
LYLPPQKSGQGRGGQKILSDPGLMSIFGEIQQAIELLKSQTQDSASRVLLVVDQLDLLLATGDEHIGAVEIGEMLVELREVRRLSWYTDARG